MKCHICENETDFVCDGCGEPVCFDCCTPMTIHNQIDYPLCVTCNDVRNENMRQEWEREHEKKEAELKLKEERRKKAKANYWKPENIAKRAERRAERKKEREELLRKQLEEAVRVVGEMFRMVR